MTYATELAALSRTPVTLVEIDLDRCTKTFGVGSCLATGEKCYLTRGTCKYPPAYDRISVLFPYFTRYQFSTGMFADAQACRPYIQSVSYLPNEIKTSLAVTGRVTIALADEPDGDHGTVIYGTSISTNYGTLDPYLSTRASVQGRYWRKW